MAVGRITGPLLSKNLLRDGVDLAFETDLLYLDVKTGQIGIKTATPQYTLDVNGTARLGKITVSGSTVTNTQGNLVIQAPVGNKVIINNDTLVDGNIHATGNITANGSVQIGNMTGSDTLSLYADIISDITPQTANTYNIGSEDKTWANGYYNNIVAGVVAGLPGQDLEIGIPTGQSANVAPIVGPNINLNGNVRIWGDNPLGTSPVVSNVLYVSMDGSDTNDGQAADATRACRTISGAVRSPFYKAGTSIKVAPGFYLEDNPIELKPYTSIIGSDLRTTMIEPINKTQDLFWLDSGNYLAQMQFSNGRSGLLPGPGYKTGTNRGAYATAFNPRYNQAKIDLYHSPYIQNCTNQSGPWLQDGTMFNPNQTVQIPQAVGSATWETNTTTLLVSVSEGVLRVGQTINVGPTPQDYVNARTLLLANKAFLQEQVLAYIDQNSSVRYNTTSCIRDTGLIVDSITIDLLFDDNGYTQSNFSGLQYWAQSGYVDGIANELTTTTAAINYVNNLAQQIVQNITIPVTYQNTVTQVTSSTAATISEANLVDADFNVILTILNSGTSGVSDLIVPNGISPVSTNTQYAYNLLQLNREFLQAETVAYVNSTTVGFVYDQAKCYRDVGYMVDSVSFDVLYGGNRQAVQSGVYYYGFSTSTSVISTEKPQTTAAYNRLKNIIPALVTNTPVVKTIGNSSNQNLSLPASNTSTAAVLQGMIDLITDIINDGPSAADEPISIGLGKNTDPNYIKAVDILRLNKSFIQSEIIAYIDKLYAEGVFNSTFVYNRAKCRRDIGIILENVAYDVAFGGNAKSVESGLAYWDNVTSVIPNEITQTADAFNYLNTLSQAVIANTTATELLGIYQTAPQVINYAITDGETAGPLITKLIGVINDIIVNGPEVAPPSQVGDGPDWGSVSAEVLLQTNRSFIQKEVVNWVNDTYPDFKYNEQLCYRDTGLIIDAITQDIILNANVKSIEAADSYWTGTRNVLENAEFGQKNQVVETLAALDRAKDVSLQVISNTTVTTSGFTFNPSKCYRDTGLIVDALAQDLLFEGNSQTTFAGIQYWNQLGYVGDISSEISTTTAAINYVKEVAQQIVQNISTGTRYQNTVSQITTSSVGTLVEAEIIGDRFDLITNILTSGTSGVTDLIIPNGLDASSTASVVNSYNLLQINKDYLKAEAIAWVEANKEFRYNPTKCARDVGLIVQSLAVDLAFPTDSFSQSTFAGLQYWNQNSYVGEIASELTTTTDTISYISSLSQKIIVSDTSGTRYSTGTQVTSVSTASSAEVTTINNEFNTILNIINSGTSGISDLIIANGITSSTVSTVKNAYNLLLANKEYIVQEAIAYVEATKTPGFYYSTSTCARDVGYIIDSVSFDVLYGGNRQAVQSGAYYYGFNTTSSIPGEMLQTVAAFQFINALSEKIIANIEVTPLQDSVPQVLGQVPVTDEGVFTALDDQIYKIIDIIERGPGRVGVKEPITLAKTLDVYRNTAAQTLLNNINFIKAETIAYIDQNFAFQYDPATCARDVGYIIDSVSFDLLYGGNRQSIQSGVYYWGYSEDSTSLPKERVATTLAYEYLKTLVSDIVISKPLASTYQTSSTQILNLPAATTVEVENLVEKIDNIILIINEGPDQAGPKTPIGLVETPNTFVQNAVRLLSVNRSFIQTEVNAFVNAQLVADTQTFLPFYDKGANATLDVERNFAIISNIIENGPEVAPIVSQGNGIFVKTGLSVNDIKSAPVITAINTVSTGVYQVDISQSTIGYGDDQTLYFGETSVYPKLDEDVPDRWQQRRLDPIGSMGGSLVDGGVISDRSPIKSFVYDAYTQVNQGGRGIRVINNGYAQLVSVFTIFCSEAVTVENGGICSITNSNSNFGDICLTAKGYGKREFSGYVKNPPFPTDVPNGEFFPAGYWPQAGQVQVYIADPELRPHIALVMEVEPPSTFINNQGFPGFLGGNTTLATLTTGSITITGLDTTGMTIGHNFYVKDQFGRIADDTGTPYVRPGTIISDIGYESIILNYPLLTGGGDPNNSNYFNIFTSGNAYYTVLSSYTWPDPITPGTLLLPDQQNAQEAVSLGYLNTLSQAIITNTSATNIYSTGTQVFDLSLQGGGGAGTFISNELSLIGSILVNGPSSAPEITRSGTLPSGAASAASLLKKNRSFLQDEIIAYVDQTFTGLVYNKAKCRRDVGFLVDAVVYDLENGGNYNAVIAGKSYYATTGTHHIVQLEENVTDPALFPDGAITTFYQRSYMSASGYLFEYVGAGTNYGALPQRGVADPVQTKEVVQLNNGKVFFTSTDQNGDFRIGPGLVISQATGVLSGRTFTKSLFANLTPFILAIEG
jgi:hypothetical protein